MTNSILSKLNKDWFVGYFHCRVCR